VHAGEVAACELLEAREDLGLGVARKFLGAFLGCLDFGAPLRVDVSMHLSVCERADRHAERFWETQKSH
jgi:hypothetical protein